MAKTAVFITVLVAATIQSAIAQYGAGSLGSTPYGAGLGGLGSGLYDSNLGVGSNYGKI